MSSSLNSPCNYSSAILLTVSTLESMYPKPSFFDKLNHALDSQINDLNRALNDAKANILVAQGCMNTIEFLGGIRNGNLGLEKKSVRDRFLDGVSLLDGDNGVRLLSDLNKPVDTAIMWKLRNGLTHQYLPKIENIPGILIKAGINPGDKNDFVADITRDENYVGIKDKGWVLVVDLIKLIKAIEEGRINLIEELKSDQAKNLVAEKALSRLPELF